MSDSRVIGYHRWQCQSSDTVKRWTHNESDLDGLPIGKWTVERQGKTWHAFAPDGDPFGKHVGDTLDEALRGATDLVRERQKAREQRRFRDLVKAAVDEAAGDLDALVGALSKRGVGLP